jgi:uncharacterized protein (UPF0335 family)
MTIALDTNAPSSVATNQTLKQHFDQALALLEQKADLAADIGQWREKARKDGLDPRALLKLGKEKLRDEAQRRRAAEQAEVEELYRQGLGLPLFDHADTVTQ